MYLISLDFLLQTPELWVNQEEIGDLPVDSSTGLPTRMRQQVALGSQIEWDPLVSNGEAVTQATAVWKDAQFWGLAGNSTHNS